MWLVHARWGISFVHIFEKFPLEKFVKCANEFYQGNENEMWYPKL